VQWGHERNAGDTDIARVSALAGRQKPTCSLLAPPPGRHSLQSIRPVVPFVPHCTTGYPPSSLRDGPGCGLFQLPRCKRAIREILSLNLTAMG